MKLTTRRRQFALRSALLEPLEPRTLLSVAASVLVGPQTPGATYTFRELFNNQTIGTFTRTIIGQTTFNTHPVTEIDESDNPTNAAATFVQRYFAFDANLDYISYGSVNGATTTINNPAAIIFPTGIAAGTTSTNSYTAIASSSGGNSSTQITDVITLVAQDGGNPESTFALTTPGGIFQVYEVDEARTFTNGTTTTINFQHFISPTYGEVEFTESVGNGTPEIFQLTNLTGLGNVTPAPVATQLAFAVQPSASVANATLSPAVTVDVEDANGAVVITDNSVVTLSIASGNGTLGGTVTARAVNGVATFANLTLPTAGTYTLKATDDALTTATSTSFTVTPLQLLTVAIASTTLPTTVVAGAKSGATVSLSITNPNAIPISEKFTINLGTSGGSASGLGAFSKKLTIKANSSLPVSFKIKTIPATAGTFTLTAQLVDATGTVIASPTGPTLTIAPATITLVPSAPALVTAKNGTGSVTFLLTNNGNSAASGADTFTLVTASDSALTTPATVFTKTQKLKITNAKNKKVKLKLTAAEITALNAAPFTGLKVTDYKGGTQSLLLTTTP